MCTDATAKAVHTFERKPHEHSLCIKHFYFITVCAGALLCLATGSQRRKNNTQTHPNTGYARRTRVNRACARRGFVLMAFPNVCVPLSLSTLTFDGRFVNIRRWLPMQIGYFSSLLSVPSVFAAFAFICRPFLSRPFRSRSNKSVRL